MDRSDRAIRCNVSAILQSADDLDRVVSYLKTRVPSFEVLQRDSLGQLRCLARVRHKQERAGTDEECEPCGARVIVVQTPVTFQRIEDEIRRAA
jgi:hypothetical protein